MTGLPAVPDAPSARPPAAGGCTCAAASSAATSAAATPRRCSTPPAHFHASGHAVVQSFEPGEDWFWDYEREKGVLGEPLEPPTSRPDDQSVPGPAGRVPDDWRDHIH